MADLDVTVLTPSLPDRLAVLLPDLVESVRAQTLPPVDHLIGVDYHGNGPGPILRKLVRAVDTEWIHVIGDDDVLFPTHFEEFAKYTDDADVVYSLPDQSTHPRDVPAPYDGDFDPDRLFNRLDSGLRGSFMIRAQVLEDVGGWGDGMLEFEDWDVLCRLVNAGARFVKCPVTTWEYRYHEGSVSAYLRQMSNGRMPDGAMDTYVWKKLVLGR